MANSQELGRKMATTSPGVSPAEIRPRARDSTRLPYAAKVKLRSQEVSISAVLLAFRRQLWRTTSWTKRPVGSAYSWVRSIGGDCKGGLGKFESNIALLAQLGGASRSFRQVRSSRAQFTQEFLLIHAVLKSFTAVDEDHRDLVGI